MIRPERQHKAARCFTSARSRSTTAGESPGATRCSELPGPSCLRLLQAAVLLLVLVTPSATVAQPLEPRTIPIDLQIDVRHITCQYYGREVEILNGVATRIAEGLDDYWELPWHFGPHPAGQRQEPRLIVHLTEEAADWYLVLKTVDQHGNDSSMLRCQVYDSTKRKPKPQPAQLGEFLKAALKKEIDEGIYGGARVLRDKFVIMPLAKGRVLHSGAQPVGASEGVVLLPFEPPFQSYSRSVFMMWTVPIGRRTPLIELVCEGTGTPVGPTSAGPATTPQGALRVRHTNCFPSPLPAPYGQLQQDVDVYFMEYKPVLGPVGSTLHLP